jgi:hypothetical protein
LADTKEKIDMGAWERAYQNLLQAQTSCFFWWLDNVEGYDKGKERMDELQRSLIAQVYEFCGKPIPPDLFRSSYA